VVLYLNSVLLDTEKYKNKVGSGCSIILGTGQVYSLLITGSLQYQIPREKFKPESSPMLYQLS
jgi:hypothetical protein